MAESYLHYHAKNSLASWLRKMQGKKWKGLNNIIIKCLGVSKSPMFGVYTEFPVCKDKNTKKIIGLDISWFDFFAGNPTMKPKMKHGIPQKYELKEWEDQLVILHIFDVAVVDNGRLSYIFEIKHTHAMDNRKIRFVKKNKIPTYEVAAQWVIERIRGKIPWDLEYLVCYNVT